MPLNPIAKLLIVDDEAAQMKALCNTLEQEGYSTTGFTSANEALATLREQAFDLVLTDLMMPEMDGIAMLRATLEIDPNLAAVVMTGHGTIDTAVEAMRAGALDYILKPFKLSEVRPVLTRSLAARRLRMENTQLREMVGIYELSMAVSYTLHFDTVLQKVADAAFQQSRAGQVSILLPTQDGKELRVAAARGPNADHILGKRMPISEALTGWVAHSREVLANPEEAGHVNVSLNPPLRDMAGGMAVPMLTGGTLVGILYFTVAGPSRPIAPGQVRALGVLASAAASALEASSLLEQLRAAERRYRRLAENAPDIIFRYELHPRRNFSFVNPRITKITGYSPEEHYADPDLGFRIVHPDDRPLLESILRGESPTGESVTLRWVHRGGAVIWIEQRHALVHDRNGRLVAIECIARDVTERKQLEDQLRQSQKMEAVGRLAGGVAHDFNNLLTVINGYSADALDRLDEHHPVYEEIAEVGKAGERAASLTRQLLTFSRRQVFAPQLLSLNAVVADMDRMLRRVLGEDVDLVTALDPALESVHADRGQIEQVIMNLAVNARDAMPGGGRLLIETANVELDGALTLQSGVVAPGRYAMLAVTDTGSGMDKQTQARIFEPFFTTKPAGEGTGLGLSTVYGVAKQSGGDIEVRSEPGKGATFKVYLPRVADRSDPIEQRPAAAPVTGNETILVVEDEDSIRKLIQTVLKRAGYAVLEARSGPDALRCCENRVGPIHLVVTDVVMPQMSGRELASRLAVLRPEIRLLFMSGYTDSAMAHHGVLDLHTPFLQKPFTPVTLAAKVREALNG